MGSDEKPNSGGFAQSIWNSSTGEFLGRTGSSWFKITLFYLVFYCCLAGFWALFLYIFYQTIDMSGPKFTIENFNPGISFQPKTSSESTNSIWVANGTHGENATYWSDALSSFLEPYENSSELANSYAEQCDGKNKYASQGKFCLFDIRKVSENCNEANIFGYQNGQPCVLIKLNRIFNWVPEPYTDADLKSENIPEFVKNQYPIHASGNQSIYVTCDGESKADKQHMGPLAYYPEDQGLEFKYFPFANLPGYLSPFVFVQFTKPTRGVTINIFCMAWAKNLDPGHATVYFQLRV